MLYQVTNTNKSGIGSLSDAIAQANSNAGVDTITFNLLANSIIESDNLALSDSAQTIIDGSGVSGLTIKGNVGAFRIGVGATVSINGLTLSGSLKSGGGVGTIPAPQGGAIYNDGNLTVSNSTLSGNRIYVLGLVGVSSGGLGGAIYNSSSGNLTVSNSTLFGNSTNGYGGGIYNDGTLTLNNSTISGNSASIVSGKSFLGGIGGGLFNNGSLKVSNSIISGNSAVYGDAEIHSPIAVISGGYNLFGYGGSSRSANLTTAIGDIIPTVALDQILSSTLANNGGPTQTLALVAGSPAINAGDPSNNSSLTTDQRGNGFNRIQGGRLDIGAFESDVGSSSGDPHIITFDQLHYEFQAIGDFVLTRALDSDLEVQVRQAPWVLNPSATLNTALATVVDGNRVEFYIDQSSPIVNGVSLNLQPGETQTLGQGSISRSLTTLSGYGMQGDLYTLIYPNGDVLTNIVFNGLLMDPSLDLGGSKNVVGLLGNHNGNTEDDLVLQDGSVLFNPLDLTALYGDFANNWRVSDTQSLFSSTTSGAEFSVAQNNNDTLTGLQNLSVNPDTTKTDLLTGSVGANPFILGDQDNQYYAGFGQQDYALIPHLWSEDFIQLHGSASDYLLGAAPSNLETGTGIFLASDPNELIGIIQDDVLKNLNLSNSAMFHYV